MNARRCTACDRTLTQPDELTSGLCLPCLNGPELTAQVIRAKADAMTPRHLPDGRINTSHVAIEQTMRERAGLPSYIPDLDGPGRFLPRCPPHDPDGRRCRTCGATLPTF